MILGAQQMVFREVSRVKPDMRIRGFLMPENLNQIHWDFAGIQITEKGNWS